MKEDNDSPLTIILTLIFWSIVFSAYVFCPPTGCATTQPTAQENSDYCQGQRTICEAQCPEVPPITEPRSPCLRDCQHDFDRCLRFTTTP